MTCRYNWSRVFFGERAGEWAAKLARETGKKHLCCLRACQQEYRQLHGIYYIKFNQFFLFLRNRWVNLPCTMRLMYVRWAGIFFLILRTKISFVKMSLLIWPMTWFMVKWARCSQSNPIDFQTFDWLRLGSVLELNRTHPKILPIKHNRT